MALTLAFVACQGTTPPDETTVDDQTTEEPTQGEDPTEDLLNFVLSVASGEKAKNEQYGYEEISIFKDGVTL